MCAESGLCPFSVSIQSEVSDNPCLCGTAIDGQSPEAWILSLAYLLSVRTVISDTFQTTALIYDETSKKDDATHGALNEIIGKADQSNRVTEEKRRLQMIQSVKT